MTVAPAAPSGRHLENLSLFLAAGALVVGVLVGLVSLDEATSFAGGGRRSVAEIASLTSGVCSGLVVLGMLLVYQGRILPWSRDVHPARRALDIGGLTLMMGTLALFGMRAFSRVVSAAFIGLRLDIWAGTGFIALSCAICVYAIASAAGRLTTESLSVLVSVFLILGALLSAVNASDQYWWRVHFSSLGMRWDFSGFAFNYTLLLTGIVITTLADFLTHDMRVWLERSGQRPWKVYFVRIGLIVMGVMLGGVGLIPVNLSHFGHLAVTYGAIGAFILLAFASPIILRHIPWGFRLVSWAILGFVAVLWILHREVRYLNTTAFEMIAVTTVLVWMVLFIRTVVAAARDLPAPETTPAVEPSTAERA